MARRKMKAWDWIATSLVLVGGLNWGLVAVKFNLVEAIFGIGTTLTSIIYGLVGVAAVYSFVRLVAK